MRITHPLALLIAPQCRIPSTSIHRPREQECHEGGGESGIFARQVTLLPHLHALVTIRRYHVHNR